jgi:NO-binding membrane sensor protein with MHYT domain
MGLQIGQVLEPSYGLGMICLSYLVACIGSMLALLCAEHMFRADGTLDLPVAVSGAVALGGIGIWSMHFIGMIAYRLPVAIAYDVPLTAASLLAAVVIAGLALYLAGSGCGRFNKAGWLAGSLLAGIGVCVMHYTGMFAQNMRASMEFDLKMVALSVAIAVTAAAAALWLAFNLSRRLHQLGAAAVMGLAVCAMHYVGMSAATVICTAAAPANAFTVDGGHLGLMVFGVAGIVLSSVAWVVSERSIEATERAATGQSSRMPGGTRLRTLR